MMMPYSKRLPLCPICKGRVELENSKTNEAGKAVHEDCYVSTLNGPANPIPPKQNGVA
jgi:hypothetical protein